MCDCVADLSSSFSIPSSSNTSGLPECRSSSDSQEPKESKPAQSVPIRPSALGRLDDPWFGVDLNDPSDILADLRKYGY